MCEAMGISVPRTNVLPSACNEITATMNRAAFGGKVLDAFQHRCPGGLREPIA